MGERGDSPLPWWLQFYLSRMLALGQFLSLPTWARLLAGDCPFLGCGDIVRGLGQVSGSTECNKIGVSSCSQAPTVGHGSVQGVSWQWQRPGLGL